MNTIKYVLISFLVVFLSGLLHSTTIYPDSISDIITDITEQKKVLVANELVLMPVTLSTFYVNRDLKKAWVGNDGLNVYGLTALNIIVNAKNDGLNPDDYHFQKIVSLKESLEQSDLAVSDRNSLSIQLDILLTDGYITLLRHIRYGKLHPENHTPLWSIGEDLEAKDCAEFMENSIRYNKLEADYEMLVPKQPRYLALKSALAELYSDGEGGQWSKLTVGDKLELDSNNVRVADLKQRLKEEGYVIQDTIETNAFDAELDSIVKVFQSNHGLLADGVVGPATIRVLNVPIEERIKQVKINLERWRWYEDKLKTDHIRVNITNFNLEVIKNQETVFDCRAIVGRKKRETPEFSGTMKYIVINPYWTVPPGILKKDIIPSVKKDSSYLDRKKIRLVKGDSIYDAKAIDWETVNVNGFIYRQDPGKHNSMGLIKFMFPNKHNVYIHDTPKKSLFSRAERTFSSGCIRIQKPVQLAELLLKDQDDWDLDKIMKTLEDKDPKVTVGLAEKVPVEILYYTAWGDKGKPIQFRNDIYEKDRKVWQGLIATPPKP